MEVKKSVSHNPGDIVKLGGIEFVVLANNMGGSYEEPQTLFILALKSQGRSQFGKSNTPTDTTSISKRGTLAGVVKICS